MQNDRRKHPLDWFFQQPLIVRALVFGLLAAIAGGLIDEAAHLWGYPWFFERLVGNVLEGLIVAGISFWLGRQREIRLERRMREIGFLNHHIRNALQAIEFASFQIADVKQRTGMIEAEVSRCLATLGKISRSEDLETFPACPDLQMEKTTDGLDALARAMERSFRISGAPTQDTLFRDEIHVLCGRLGAALEKSNSISNENLNTIRCGVRALSELVVKIQVSEGI